MVWLIYQLVRGLKIGIRGMFVGPPSFHPRREKPAVNNGRKGPVVDDVSIPYGNRRAYQQFCYGSMVIRVWRNWNKRSEMYLNIEIVRQVDGRLAKSFRPEDVDDVERCVLRLRAWLRDGN